MPNIGDDQIIHFLLGGQSFNRSLSIMQSVYLPGSDTGVQVEARGGEGGGIVVEGQLEVSVGAEVQLLEPDDGYFFELRRPHRLRNIGECNCVVITANSIPPS